MESKNNRNKLIEELEVERTMLLNEMDEKQITDNNDLDALEWMDFEINKQKTFNKISSDINTLMDNEADLLQNGGISNSLQLLENLQLFWKLVESKKINPYTLKVILKVIGRKYDVLPKSEPDEDFLLSLSIEFDKDKRRINEKEKNNFDNDDFTFC